jgi:phenylalanyl-tRNA synthetase beta chain
LNHGQRNLRLFEIGKAYSLHEGEPVERMVLTLGATGLAREKTIHEDAREFTFADLKGDIDRVGELADGFRWWDQGGSTLNWFANSRSANISLLRESAKPSVFYLPPYPEPIKLKGGPWIGSAGQIARRIADQLKLRQGTFVAELQLEPLLAGIELAARERKFVPIPRFPAVERDFSLVLADGVHFAQVVETIRALEIPELRGVEALDLFRGGQVPAGKFSLMIRVTFQSAEATLTDAQIAEFSSRIVGALETKLGAALRAS